MLNKKLNPALRQTNASINYISLTRSDLIKTKETAFFDEINLFDFKISIYTIHKAKQIIFVDGVNSKVFKSRHGIK